MTPTKQTVYLPVNGKSEQCVCNDYPDWMQRIESVVEQEGYFFTPEQLNEYTANVIKQTLETAAENAYVDFEDYDKEFVNKKSITKTFEETFQKYKL